MARKAPKGAECKPLRSYWSAGINKGRLSKPQGHPCTGLVDPYRCVQKNKRAVCFGFLNSWVLGGGAELLLCGEHLTPSELWRPPNPWENFRRKQGRLWESVPSHYLYILYNCLLAISGILSQILVIIFAHLELEAVFMVWPGSG